MKIKAAVINSVNEPYVMEELNISEPNDNELLVKMVASGMCHSDVELGQHVVEAEQMGPNLT